MSSSRALPAGGDCRGPDAPAFIPAVQDFPEAPADQQRGSVKDPPDNAELPEELDPVLGGGPPAKSDPSETCPSDQGPSRLEGSEAAPLSSGHEDGTLDVDAVPLEGNDRLRSAGLHHPRHLGLFPAAPAWGRVPEDSDRQEGEPPDSPPEVPTERDDPAYNIESGVKLAVVLNNQTFLDPSLPERNGTKADCEAIERVFSRLGFQVEEHDDPTVNDICRIMMGIGRRTDLSCLALFILTHGEERGTLHAHDTLYRLNKVIVDPLLPRYCRGLAAKPKLVFIQACQGTETDAGTTVRTERRVRHTSDDSSGWFDGGYDQATNFCIPNYADLLIFQASYHGHYAFRHGTSGSWFIQCLCEEIDQSLPDEDLSSVLCRVSRRVALTKSSVMPSRPDLHDKRQIPLKQDTLIRQVYLKGRSSSRPQTQEQLPELRQHPTAASSDKGRHKPAKDSKPTEHKKGSSKALSCIPM